MDLVIQKFRGALGGFNRRDVLQYMEQMSAAHRQELARLEQELALERQERERLEATLAGLEDEKGSVAAEEARVRASLEQSTTLSHLRGELSQTETKLAVARQELARLQSQVGELSPMAKSYQELKDRVATVELDAHRKAQATVDEAQAQAEALKGETRQWLEEVLARYGGVREVMDELFRGAEKLKALEEQAGQADQRAAELKEQAGLK